MENLKEKLKKEAVQKYGKIKRIATGKDFTIEGKQLWYWFNDTQDSTHIITGEI